MKKLAAIILTAAMALTLCGCYDIYDPAENAPVPKYSVCVDFSKYADDTVLDEESGECIFTQSVCEPTVISAGNERAADKINADLELRSQSFIEGASAMKNLALGLVDDNARPGVMEEAEGETPPERGSVGPMTCIYQTSATLTRGDVGVISISFDTFTYSAGAAHGYVSRECASYDAKTGEKLTLDTVAEDAALLRQLVYGYMLNISTGEKYQRDGTSIFFENNLTEELSALVESEQWYFSDKGLVFFANPYELAPYAFGRVDFTIPYAAMDGLLKGKYMPVEFEGEAGMMLAESGKVLDKGNLKLLGTVTLDADMQSVVVSAEETVYSVELVKMRDDMIAVPETLVWYRSYMTTDEALEVICSIPDVSPNLILRYVLADGTVIERGIFQSGKDGSIMLVELTDTEG